MRQRIALAVQFSPLLVRMSCDQAPSETLTAGVLVCEDFRRTSGALPVAFRHVHPHKGRERPLSE